MKNLLLITILFCNIAFANAREELINIAKSDFDGLYCLFIYEILSYSDIEIDPEVKYEFSESKRDKKKLLNDLSYKLARMGKINLSYQIYEELGIKVSNWHDIAQTENFEKLFNEGLYGKAFEYVLKFNNPVITNQNNNEKKFFTYLNRFLYNSSVTNISEYLNQINNSKIDYYIKARILCSSVQFLGKDRMHENLRDFFVRNKYENYDLDKANDLINILRNTLENINDSKKKNTIKVNIGVLYSDIGDVDNANKVFQELLLIKSSRVNDYKIYMYVKNNDFQPAFDLAYDSWVSGGKHPNYSQTYKEILFEYLKYKMSISDKEYYNLLKEIGERCTSLNIKQDSFKDYLNELKVNSSINSTDYAKSIKFILKQKRNSSELLTNLFDNCIKNNKYEFAIAIYDSSIALRGMNIEQMSMNLIISDFQRSSDVELKLISNIDDRNKSDVVDTLLSNNNINLVEKILQNTNDTKTQLAIIYDLINFYSTAKSEELLLKYLNDFLIKYTGISKYNNIYLEYWDFKRAVDVSLQFKAFNQYDNQNKIWQHTIDIMDYKDFYGDKEIKFHYHSNQNDISSLYELEGECSRKLIEYFFEDEKVDEAFKYANENSCTNNWVILLDELIQIDSTKNVKQILKEKLIIPLQDKIDNHNKYFSEFVAYSQTYNKDLDYYGKKDWGGKYNDMVDNIEKSLKYIAQSSLDIIEIYLKIEEYDNATILLNDLINLFGVTVDFTFNNDDIFYLGVNDPNNLKFSFWEPYISDLLNTEYDKNIFFINDLDSTHFITDKYLKGKNDRDSYRMKNDNDLLAKHIQLYLWTVLDDTTNAIDRVIPSITSAMNIKSNNYKYDFDKIMGEIDLALFVKNNDIKKSNLILFNAFQKILKLDDFDEMKASINNLSETLGSHNYSYSGLSVDKINKFISTISTK